MYICSSVLRVLLVCHSCRHTEDMIKKLESAGLGFYVRDTQQKLGIWLYIHFILGSIERAQE